MDSIAPLPGTQSLAALAVGEKPARVVDAKSITKRPVEKSESSKPGENPPEDDSEESIRASIAEFFSESRDIRVELDDPSGRVIFQSVDRETGEVKRQVPSEEMVKLVARLRNPTGVLVDSTV
ncbi:flagellar protein FlaG [Tepidicaulis sp. LMO-SS28]|uniref:flagellar protein FlaG n=1 Tax=Tepidicaulis sp. LMO-SS28 TaxID=3447455 RepID=UPI003EDF6B78